MHKTMALLLLLVVAFVPGCGVFGMKHSVVFVQEATELDGMPRQILKTTEPTTVDVVYYNGKTWVLVTDVTIPAGWVIASPAVVKEFETPDT